MIDRVSSVADLEALYGEASPTSIRKETDHLTPEYRAFVEASPFVLVASAGAEGLDCSPRGDAPGFVAVEDERTLLIPDRRGNNRLDTLRNILADPRVALIFLVPGVAETLRVNGRAAISTAPALLERFVIDGKAPRTVLVVTAEQVYFQCAKALIRSDLWNPCKHVPRSHLPSPGAMLKGASRDPVDVAEVDRAYPDRIRATLY